MRIRSCLAVASAGLLAAMMWGTGAALAAGSDAAPREPVKIVVFDFELDDTSAGGGVIVQDANDKTYLAESTEMAKRLLVESGTYDLVVADSAGIEAVAAQGIRNCDGCEAAIARDSGADQAMVGTVKRIGRTEYAVLIKIVDAQSGATVSNAYSDLRMGANYAWSRGVRSLMRSKVLAVNAKN